MSIPYRTRQAIRRIFVTVLALVMFVALALVGWLLWLNRFVVYSPDGVRLDFSLSSDFAPPQPDPEVVPPLKLPIRDPQASTEPPEAPRPELPESLVRFSGYYVTLADLTERFDQVCEQLAALPQGSTILFELKDVSSYVYYTSQFAPERPGFDTAKVDALIQQLRRQGHYIIARVPAFQEKEYILEDQRGRFDHGLEHTKGGSLWWDSENRCYWLNPTSEGALAYLLQLIGELRSLGFHEVVFSDFRFPDTDKIIFEGDRDAALVKTASLLVKTCSTDSFCVSFIRSGTELPLPQGRTRLYLAGIAAADAAREAAKTQLADPSAQVVFLTTLNDTRYDEFCVLRPLDSAH